MDKEENSNEISSAPVSKDTVEQWGKSTKEILEQAIENQRRYLPYNLYELQGLQLQKLCCLDGKPDMGAAFTSLDKRMFMVSNSMAHWGSTALTDAKCLECLGKILGTDFYILPSSIHDLIILI